MKHMRNLLAGNMALLFAAAVTASAAEGWTRYNTQPAGNLIRIEGTSSIHDWTVESKLIGGYLEVGPNFPVDPAKAQPGKVDAKVEVYIPVRTLKSMKDGKPYSNAMDDIMYEKMLEGANKQIKYTLTELVVKEAPKSAGAPVLLEAKGNLTVAGATKEVTMPVEMTADGEKLKFSGKVATKMTTFGMEPPAPMGGTIKTGDDVKLTVNWTTVKKKS